MPPKRKTAPTAPAGPAPKRTSTRVRQPPRRPGDDSTSHPSSSANHDNPTTLAALTMAFEAHRHEVNSRLTELDAAVQTNSQQFNEIAAAINDIRLRLPSPDLPSNVRPAIPLAPTASLTGNELPLSHRDGILSRWPWVDPSLVDDINNGKFNIYDLPKLHRDEYLRNRYISKSVEGVMQPLAGGKSHIVQSKTKLQSSFKNFETFVSAWSVYVGIRTSFEPKRAPGFAMWMDRLATFVSLQYEFTSIINYVIAYFQAHQNSSPEAWFLVDSELHSEHFGNAAQRALNSLRSQPAKPSAKAPTGLFTTIPITDQVCRNWNRPSGCKIKEVTKRECLRRHVCSNCLESGHKEPSCTKAGTA